MGITIGSSTSHLVFSELTLRRGDSRESRFVVADRNVIYRSPILFTPYIGGKVDAEQLESFLKGVYEDSGFTPDTVDTGAIIITGYAARKDNAEAVVNLFSRWAGKFVCATAGPNLESIVAAHGSGAVTISKETGKTVMNVDIGGGTSKIAIVKHGTVVETASIRVGSRVIAMSEDGKLNRIDEPAAMAASELGIALRMGEPLALDDQRAIVTVLTGSLFELIERKSLSPFAERLMETPEIKHEGEVDILMFSGGVAEYIYGYEKTNFGDLGPYLGDEIRQRTRMLPITLQEPSERIRATVIGAAQHTLQVSGSTIFISNSAVLPKRNLQVVKVHVPEEEEEPTMESISHALRKALKRYDIKRFPDQEIALAIDLPSEKIAPTSALIRSITHGILSVWRDAFKGESALVLIFDLDIAKLVGSSIVEEFSGDVVCVDGIQVWDLDYVDIGSQIEYSQTVPVILKNLIFFNEYPGITQRDVPSRAMTS